MITTLFSAADVPVCPGQDALTLHPLIESPQVKALTERVNDIEPGCVRVYGTSEKRTHAYVF